MEWYYSGCENLTAKAILSDALFQYIHPAFDSFKADLNM
jgi:hypothetical protein